MCTRPHRVYQTSPCVPGLTMCTRPHRVYQTSPCVPDLTVCTRPHPVYQASPCVPDLTMCTRPHHVYQTSPCVPGLTVCTRPHRVHYTNLVHVPHPAQRAAAPSGGLAARSSSAFSPRSLRSGIRESLQERVKFERSDRGMRAGSSLRAASCVFMKLNEVLLDAPTPERNNV